MTVHRPGIFVVGALVALTIGVGAVFADGPTYSLQNVTITAAGPVPETSARSVITASQIAASGATTLGGALELCSSINVNTVGPAGSVTSPSIRGATANEVLVLVNGVSANNPLTGAVDLSTIPLNQVARIDIIRGSAAAVYGPSAIGGVIDIITKKSVSVPLTVTLENGSFAPGPGSTGTNGSATGPDLSSLADSQRLSLTGGGLVGKTNLAATGEVRRSANGYRYRDSSGGWLRLENAGLFGADGSLNLSRAVGKGKLSLLASGNFQSHGDPGSESYPTPQAHEKDFTSGGTLQYHTRSFFSDLLDLSLALHGGYSEVRYADPGSGVLSDHRLWTFDSSLGQKAYLTNDFTLGYGVSAAYNSVDSTSVGKRSRFQSGFYLSPRLSIGRFSVRPSARFDYLSDLGAGAFSLQLDITDRVSHGLSLWLNAARAVRFPTLNDLYTPLAYGAEGNPNLKPETAVSANVGLGLAHGPFSYDFSIYGRYARNLILWQAGGGGLYRPVNYGVALYPGVEQHLSLALPDGFSLRVGYAFLYSFALAGGLTLASNARMPMTPQHTVTAAVEHRGRVFTWSAGGRFQSSRLWVDNSTVLPPFFVLNAHASWRIGRRWSSYLSASNILNEQYQTELGYPMPPTELRVGLVARL